MCIIHHDIINMLEVTLTSLVVVTVLVSSIAQSHTFMIIMIVRGLSHCHHLHIVIAAYL